MDDAERLMECLNCAYLQVCTLEDNERDDENGHCTEYVELKEQKDG